MAAVALGVGPVFVASCAAVVKSPTSLWFSAVVERPRYARRCLQALAETRDHAVYYKSGEDGRRTLWPHQGVCIDALVNWSY